MCLDEDVEEQVENLHMAFVFEGELHDFKSLVNAGCCLP